MGLLLLVFFGVALFSQAGFANKTESSTTIFAYDGIGQPTIACDDGPESGFVYDAGTVLTIVGKEPAIPGERDFFGNCAEFLAAEGGAFKAIGSTGKVGEQWLAQNLGGESQVFFNTSQGARYVDQLANGIANESKVGYQSLTPSIQLQISKDVELLNTR